MKIKTSELTGAALDWAPENIRGILARCRDFIDTTKAPAYPAGADLADEIDVLLAAQPAPLPGTAYAALPEPLEIDWPELHSQALGCGVEDRDLHNRYECAEYGWQDGVDKCAERVPEQIFDADQMLAFADATHMLRASHGQAYPTIGDLCARIKAADDAAADRDYMLDSNDCIAVLRGEWKGPLTMDKPERASHGQAPATQQVGEPECYKWEHYCRWGHGWGWGECESEYDPRLPENKQYHTEDFNDPEQVRNFRALYRHTPPSLPTAQADSVPSPARSDHSTLLSQL